jgi:hypothetical protein
VICPCPSVSNPSETKQQDVWIAGVLSVAWGIAVNYAAWWLPQGLRVPATAAMRVEAVSRIGELILPAGALLVGLPLVAVVCWLAPRRRAPLALLLGLAGLALTLLPRFTFGYFLGVVLELQRLHPIR